MIGCVSFDMFIYDITYVVDSVTVLCANSVKMTLIVLISSDGLGLSGTFFICFISVHFATLTLKKHEKKT